MALLEKSMFGREVDASATPWTATAAELLRPLAPIHVEVEFTSVDPIDLGHDPGSTFRSLLGPALKQTTCSSPRTCQGRCAGEPPCLYGLTFESPPELRGSPNVTHAPRPLVVREVRKCPSPPSDGRPWRAELLLLGPMRGRVLTLLEALDKAGERGFGEARVPFVRRFLRVRHLPEAWKDLNVGPGPVQELSVRFLTRTRLQQRHAVLNQIDFGDLIRAILRRYCALRNAYGGGEPTWDHREILALARHVQTVSSGLRFEDAQRWSSRQRRRIPKGGVVGETLYRGNLGPFLGLLGAGELLHVGKGTVMGHGLFRVRVGPDRSPHP